MNINRIIAGVSGLLIAISTSAQLVNVEIDSTAAIYADRISQDSIHSYLSVLAADNMEGRETGEPGQKKAARYIRAKFEEFGIERVPGDSSFFQPFDLYSVPYNKVSIKFGEQTWTVLEDFYTFSTFMDTVISAADFVFLGYGLSAENYDNYGSKDYTGKIGVVFEGEPQVDGTYTLSGTTQPSPEADIGAKVRLARERGLVALMMVQPNFDLYLPRVGNYLREPRLQLDMPMGEGIPGLRIGYEQFSKIFPKSKPTKIRKSLLDGVERFDLAAQVPTEIKFFGRANKVRTENVIGYVKGRDKSNEYVFITAHYDHLGVRGEDIYNGADDDGSGTSMVIELARIYSEAAKEGKGPSRSVVFLFFTGEEKGLLGSEYYTDHPLLALDNTVVDLNIDMIGRSDNLYGPDSTDYIYLIGSDRISKELHQISEEMNERHTRLELDYKYDDPNDPQRLYYRSDHYNFARYGIPVIFYFRGLHDDYHKPTDTIEKIEFDTIEKVGRLVFFTSWAVANREMRLKSNF